MSNYIGSEGILSRFGVKNGVLFQHGEDPNRKLMSALAVAAVLSTSITSSAFAMQPPTLTEQAPSYNQVIQTAKNNQQPTLSVIGKHGSLVTISSETNAKLNPSFAQKLKTELAKSIDIFQKTKSWDMVMADVVAPGLQSKDPATVQAALSVLGFYHYSAEKTAGVEVVPAINDATAYINNRGPALERERQVSEAYIQLDNASQTIPGEINEQSLAAAVDAQIPGSYAKIANLIHHGAPGESKLTDHLHFYQEYQLSVVNQAAQYNLGNPGKMIASVDDRVADLDGKYSYPMIVSDFVGRGDSRNADISAFNGGAKPTQVRDQFEHPAAGKEALRGLEVFTPGKSGFGNLELPLTRS